MESLLELAPLLTSLLAKLNDYASPSAGSPVDASFGPGVSSGLRLVGPPQIAAPSRSLTTPASLSHPSITLPFQFNFFDLTGTESKYTSLAIDGESRVLNLLTHYSYAKLSSLELVVFPKAESLAYPQTFDAVWATSDSVITGTDIISVYGSQRVTFGGPVSSSLPIIMPCDLKSLNPVIRDSVVYKDTPKLFIAFYQNKDNVALGVSKAVICGSIIIRGTVECSSVRPAPTK
ncbi:coat protein [Citrus virus C]|nr:coat protein [Citrus virus C]